MRALPKYQLPSDKDYHKVDIPYTPKFPLSFIGLIFFKPNIGYSQLWCATSNHLENGCDLTRKKNPKINLTNAIFCNAGKFRKVNIFT